MSIVDNSQNPVTIEGSIAEACLQESARYRTGDVTRTEATMNIITQINKSSIQDKKVLEDTTRIYLLMLDRDNAEIERNIGTGAAPPAQDPTTHQPSAAATGSRPQRKRKNSGTDSDDSDGGDGFDEKELPWYDEEKEMEGRLPASVLETRKRALQYNRHFKKTKLALLTSLQRPEFPESEWDNVLRNRVVDLDKVLTHLTIARNYDVTEIQVGSTRFRTGETPTLRVVSDHGTWLEVWSRVTEATVTLYPNRREELNQYRAIISRFFLAGDAFRVIVFDAAVRSRVAARSDLLLTDVGAFQDLVVTHLHNGYGVAEFKQREREINGGGKEPKKRVQEICNRFNLGSCPFSDASCRYRHVCRTCRRSGHKQGDMECDKKAK